MMVPAWTIARYYSARSSRWPTKPRNGDLFRCGSVCQIPLCGLALLIDAGYQIYQRWDLVRDPEKSRVVAWRSRILYGPTFFRPHLTKDQSRRRCCFRYQPCRPIAEVGTFFFFESIYTPEYRPETDWTWLAQFYRIS